MAISNEFAEQKNKEVLEYIETLLQKNGSFIAVKFGNVLIRPVEEGEKILVYTKNGNLEAEEIGQAGKYLLTRCDDNGKPIIDKYGHTNSCQTGMDVIKKKYEIDEKTGIAKPKGTPQQFIVIDRDITLYKPWGKNGAWVKQNIKAGGVLNITNKPKVYGIAAEEFAETYKMVM